MKKVGVLLSGRGSNLQALIDAARRGEMGGEIAVVVSNVEAAPGLDRARKPGSPPSCVITGGRSGRTSTPTRPH